MPRGPNNSRNWTWRPVKDGGTTLGHIRYAASDQASYRALKTEAAVTRTNRFGQRQVNNGGTTTVYASAKLRRRMPRAGRAQLAGVGVVNPGYNPGGGTHKSHLVPDIFGGPSIATNLAKERPAINLSGHKRIENRINRLMKAVTAQGDVHPTRTRGGLVVKETYNAVGKPIERIYMASIKDRRNNTRTYHKLSFKPL